MKGWVWMALAGVTAAVAGIALKTDTLKPFIVGSIPHPDPKARKKGVSIPVVSIPENLRGFIRA